MSPLHTANTLMPVPFGEHPPSALACDPVSRPTEGGLSPLKTSLFCTRRHKAEGELPPYRLLPQPPGPSTPACPLCQETSLHLTAMAPAAGMSLAFRWLGLDRQHPSIPSALSHIQNLTPPREGERAFLSQPVP